MLNINIFNIQLDIPLLKTLLKNPLSWFTLVVLLGGIITLVIKWYFYSIIFVLIACLFLIAILIRYRKDISNLKNDIKSQEALLLRIHEQFTNLHEIAHQTRNALHSFSLKDARGDSIKTSEISARIINNVLDQIASIFTGLVSADCIASIMLQSEKSSDIIKTAVRSTNTLSKRSESHPTELLKGQGMAGMCFRDGEPRWSNDFEESSKEGRFFPVRNGWKEFYQSGMSSPFKVDGKIVGVFNLDCTDRNKFEFPEKLIFLVQLGGDIVALALQIDGFLKKCT